MHPTIAEVITLFKDRGHSLYGGEAVTQLQHGLQAAVFARQKGATPALVTASLLHDIGHLLHTLPDDAPDDGIDDVHEDLGARWLENRFVADVVEPVRLHVAAKRYLCSTDENYFAQLSEPSVISLKLQGGPMSEDEVAEFRQNPYYIEAVQLRRWDELAKDPEMFVPEIEAFIMEMERVVLG